MLVVVQARFQIAWSRSEWIEDELVRSGARDAHLLADDHISVTVCSNRREAAEDLVRELLTRLGATTVEILEPEIAIA